MADDAKVTNDHDALKALGEVIVIHHQMLDLHQRGLDSAAKIATDYQQLFRILDQRLDMLVDEIEGIKLREAETNRRLDVAQQVARAQSLINDELKKQIDSKGERL